MKVVSLLVAGFFLHVSSIQTPCLNACMDDPIGSQGVGLSNNILGKANIIDGV